MKTSSELQETEHSLFLGTAINVPLPDHIVAEKSCKKMEVNPSLQFQSF